jgi:hypothetical protein
VFYSSVEDEENFMLFMRYHARTTPVEVSAYELDDGTYFLQPWHGNSKAESDNSYFPEIGRPRYLDKENRYQIVKQIHTLPGSNPPAPSDVIFMMNTGVPVYTIGKDQTRWQFDRSYTTWPQSAINNVPSNPISKKITP